MGDVPQFLFLSPPPGDKRSQKGSSEEAERHRSRGAITRSRVLCSLRFTGSGGRWSASRIPRPPPAEDIYSSRDVRRHEVIGHLAVAVSLDLENLRGPRICSGSLRDDRGRLPEGPTIVVVHEPVDNFRSLRIPGNHEALLALYRLHHVRRTERRRRNLDGSDKDSVIAVGIEGVLELATLIDLIDVHTTVPVRVGSCSAGRSPGHDATASFIGHEHPLLVWRRHGLVRDRNLIGGFELRVRVVGAIPAGVVRVAVVLPASRLAVTNAFEIIAVRDLGSGIGSVNYLAIERRPADGPV